MKHKWLDILLSLAILATGLCGGVLVEARWGIYNKLGLQSAPPAQCSGSRSLAAGADTPWEELAEYFMPGDGLPAFVEGPPQAPLQVQVYLDVECPFSQQWIQMVLPKLLERKDIWLEIHDFPLPFHSHAVRAAQAGRCAARQASYLDFLAELASFEVPNDQAIAQAASAAGLKVESLVQCLPSEESNVRLDFLAGQAKGVRATPTTVINGRGIAGLYPWETYERLLAEALLGR